MHKGKASFFTNAMKVPFYDKDIPLSLYNIHSKFKGKSEGENIHFVVVLFGVVYIPNKRQSQATMTTLDPPAKRHSNGILLVS